MKTIAIIPARGGSKRVPGKNIKQLGDKELIVHSIAYAQQNKTIIDEIYVSTDDAKIKEVALQQGVKVVDRPLELAGDLEPTVTALQHVLEGIGDAVENVILLQPTNPLRPEHLLKEAFESFESGQYDSLFTVTRNEQKLGKIEANTFIPFNYAIGQRSQDLEPLYFENGLLYISKANLIRNGIIVSKQAYPMIVKHPFAHVDIDTQEDFDYAEYLYTKFITHNP
ncbi:cytidylyltransferase domain-containing protein [Flavobacterium chuncheonense]|uniref:Cytidylyltransferase domain-containing protein n=1 Tax=Flavobacterium chuncheonense TaxID=2026653 RepID=A0ABW5YJ16_9FLAO